jgi:uncharacterized membrane protein YuzA (DUF378 family)
VRNVELKTVSKWLVIVGAINWGLVALLGVDLVQVVLGSVPMAAKLVYLLIGAAGVWGAYAMLTYTNKKKR